MPLRVMPRVGAPVAIDYLGATVHGVVRSITEEGRRLEVQTEDGALQTFALNRATARFTLDGTLSGARLRFV